MADAKARLSELVATVAGTWERIVITKNGRPAAVLMSVEDLEALLVYAWRRKLAAAVSRLEHPPAGQDAPSGKLTVGFADLVSYTRLSQRLTQRELGVLVQRFEGLATDAVSYTHLTLPTNREV